MGRTSLSAIAILFATLSAQSKGTESSTICSDFFEVNIGPGANAEDKERCAALLRIMDRLREDLDRALVDAKVLKASEAKRKPREPWKVYWFKNLSDSRAFLKTFSTGLEAAPGVYFWCGPEFREPFLTFVPTENRTVNMQKLLEQGTNFILAQRLRINTCLRSDDRGVPLLYGLSQYMRYSVFPSVLDYPRQLGGCPIDAIERLRAKVEDGSFPTLEFLFSCPKNAYTGAPDELHFPSVVLVEFLLEGDGMEPSDFYAVLEGYRGRASGSDGKKAYQAFLKQYARKVGDEQVLLSRFQAHIRDKSLALNKEKWDKRDGAAGGGK